MTAHEIYKPIEAPAEIEPCACCGGTGELYQFSETETSPVNRVVMCTTSETIGPRDALTSEGCLLYMPPDDFYRATGREAVKYWNEFQKALGVMQRTKRWKRAQVLRGGA